MSTSNLDALLAWLWQTTWQAALLAAVVWVATRLLRRWLSPGAVQMLWLLVFIRLAMPALPESSWSVLQRAAPPPKPVAKFVEMPSATFIPQADIVLPVQRYTPAPVIQTIPWKALTLFSVWFVGAIWMFSRTLSASLRFARQLSRTSKGCGPKVSSLIESCCVERGVRVPAILVTDLIATPALAGVTRPRLLLTPASLAMESEALRGIILHELEHLRRRHLLADWILTFIRSLHWFNPAAWIAHRQIRAARELLCDRAVINRLNEKSAIEYGHTMLDIAESLSLHRSGAAITAAFASDRGVLRDRIDAIARGRRRYIAGLGIILATILSAAFLTKPSTAQVGIAPASQPSSASATQPNPVRYTDVVRYPTSWPSRLREGRRVTAEEANREALHKLERTLPSVDFDNIPLNEAIEQMRDMTSVDIFVNWRALEAAGVQRNTPVTLRLQNVKSASAVETLLRNVGGSKVQLGSIVEDGVMTISTHDDLPSNVETRRYDISDLLQPAAPQMREQLVKDLMRFIQDNVAANSWKDNNGKLGSIRELNGQLIVTQTPQNQLKIIEMIMELRRTRGSAIQIKLEAKFIIGAPSIVEEQSPAGKWTKLGDAEVWSEFLADAQTEKIFRALEQRADSTTLTAPKLVVLERQPTRVASGTDRAYVKDFKIGRDGSLEPVVATFNSGVDLQCEASVLPDRKHVGLKLHPKLTRLESITTEPWKSPPGGDAVQEEVPMVQILNWVVVETDQQIEIPSQVTLVMRLKPQRANGEEANDLDSALLLVRAEIIEPANQ